jgi:hypothetical protein
MFLDEKQRVVDDRLHRQHSLMRLRAKSLIIRTQKYPSRLKMCRMPHSLDLPK